VSTTHRVSQLRPGQPEDVEETTVAAHLSLRQDGDVVTCDGEAPLRVMTVAWCLNTDTPQPFSSSIILADGRQLFDHYQDTRPEVQCWLAETSHPSRFTITKDSQLYVNPSQPAVCPHKTYPCVFRF
jgi:hypothetical protein